MQKENPIGYLKLLNNETSFSRNDLKNAMCQYGVKISVSNFKVVLQKLLEECQIVRVGRNAYCVANENVQNYNYQYSELATAVAMKIEDKFPYLDFTILELIQLNEFVNHQLAHNVVFVSVEEDLGEYVFQELKEHYMGKVLINPTPEIYHQYWSDNMIVIQKLVSEAPSGRKIKWHTRLEKMLIDLYMDILLKNIISQAEIPTIYEQGFSKYGVDESCLFRYAKRRGADKKIKNFISEKTNIELRG